ncbi:MAG: hypothetical protein JW862_08980 [Anaerolineales bacterium]|nr:hypothetical protein [Anaerolineales bacterium]
MRYRDYSPIPEKEGQLTFSDRLNGMLKYGLSWPKEMESQRVVVDYLKRHLDNRFTLLRNLLLPDANITLPLLLVGPQGITLINPTPTQGVFSAKEGTWQINMARGYQPATPNWLQRTQLLAKAVNIFLERKDITLVEAEAVLVFTHPGTHVDTNRPIVRVLLVDALSRFAAGLSQAQPRLSGEEIYNLVHVLTSSAEAEEEVIDPVKVPQQLSAAPVRPSRFEQSLDPLQKTFNFDRKQWLILAALTAGIVVILMVFLLFILLFA